MCVPWTPITRGFDKTRGRGVPALPLSSPFRILNIERGKTGNQITKFHTLKLRKQTSPKPCNLRIKNRVPGSAPEITLLNISKYMLLHIKKIGTRLISLSSSNHCESLSILSPPSPAPGPAPGGLRLVRCGSHSTGHSNPHWLIIMKHYD